MRRLLIGSAAVIALLSTLTPAAGGSVETQPGNPSSMLGDGCARDGVLRGASIAPALRPCAIEVLPDGRAQMVPSGIGGGAMMAEASTPGWEEFPRAWPQRRVNAAMAYLPALQAVILYGGLACPSLDCVPMGDTWAWDGDGWSRLQPTVSPPPLHAPAMTYDPARQELVLFGGETCTSDDCTLSSETWTFDGTTWERQSPPISPPASSASAMAYDPGSSRVLLSGGCAQDRCPGLVGTWSWDGTSWELEDLLRPTPRYGAIAATDPEEGVVMFGGSDLTGSSLGETWRWSGSTWTQLQPPVSAPHRRLAGIAFDEASDEVVMFAGSSATCTLTTCVGGYRSDLWTWDGETWTERPVAPGVRGGQSLSLAYDAARDLVVRFGGISSFANSIGAMTSAHEVNTWLWDGEGWTERRSLVPEERLYGAMGFHPTARVLVLAGGYCPYTTTCDSWTWDGTAWTRIDAPVPAPISRRPLLPRDAAGTLAVPLSDAVWSLEYDRQEDAWAWTSRPGTGPPGATNGLAAGRDRRDRLIVFGAQVCDTFPCSYSDRTWTWDDAAWTEPSPGATTPPGRAFASMAYDVAGERTFMFGGLTQGGTQYYDDTWMWDGQAWVEAPATGPPARAFAPIAADPATGKIMVLGGIDGTPQHAVLADQWLFDGDVWEEVGTPGGPMPRIEFGIGSYPPGPSTVLFGGMSTNPGLPRSDTWVWTG